MLAPRAAEPVSENGVKDRPAGKGKLHTIAG